MSNDPFPELYLARHGETEWSRAHRHTSVTDLPLTERGERNARRLGERLAGFTFAKVYASPLQRAMRTCTLAPFPLFLPVQVADKVAQRADRCGFGGPSRRARAPQIHKFLWLRHLGPIFPVQPPGASP
jgi:Histidine phosphatase superfamily (branch 1)